MQMLSRTPWTEPQPQTEIPEGGKIKGKSAKWVPLPPLNRLVARLNFVKNNIIVADFPSRRLQGEIFTFCRRRGEGELLIV